MLGSPFFLRERMGLTYSMLFVFKVAVEIVNYYWFLSLFGVAYFRVKAGNCYWLRVYLSEL